MKNVVVTIATLTVLLCATSSAMAQRAGLGRNAGFTVIGPSMTVKASDITDAADGSQLAKTDPLTLFKWDEDSGGWLAYSDLTNEVDRIQGAALFLFDDSDDTWTDDTFTISFKGEMLPKYLPRTDTVSAGASENSWLWSNPWITYIDPRDVHAGGGADWTSTFSEHARFWNYVDDEWEYYSFADSAATMTSMKYRFFFPSGDGMFAESHTSGQNVVVFDTSGVGKPSTIESSIGSPSTLIVEDSDDLYVPRYARENEKWVQIKIHLLMRGGAETYLFDEKTWMYFYSGATRDGFDRYDASNLNPMKQQFAVSALEGTKFGSPRMQSILSLPRSPSLPITRPLRVATRDLQGTLEITADSANVPSDWGIQITDTKKTSSTGDDTSTQLGKKVGEGYRFKIRNPRPNPSGPPDLITRQDSADAGAVPRFRITIDKESNL